MKDFLAVHLGLLCEDACSKEVLLDLGERQFMRLQILVSKNESTDEKPRIELFIKLSTIELQAMHRCLLALYEKFLHLNFCRF